MKIVADGIYISGSIFFCMNAFKNMQLFLQPPCSFIRNYRNDYRTFICILLKCQGRQTLALGAGPPQKQSLFVTCQKESENNLLIDVQ